MRQVRVSSWEDERVAPLLFVSAFALGSIAVLAAKFQNALPEVVVVTPVIVITAYASMVFVPKLKLRWDQTGDNAYYLGFLFTLISLAWSLYRFDPNAGAEAIVRNFGVAVSSTIWGIFARVLLNLGHRTPSDIERSARIALSDAVKNLRDEMAASTEALVAYRRESQQAAAEELRNLRDIAVTQLKETSDAVDKTIKGATKRIDAVTNRWGGAAETFNDRSEALVAAVTSLATNLESVRFPSSIIEEKLSAAGKAVAELASNTTEAMSGLAAALDRVEAGASAIEQAAAGARHLFVVSLQQTTALQEANAILIEAKAHLDELKVSSSRFEGAITSASTELTSALSTLIARLDAQVQRAQHVNVGVNV